MPNTAGQASSGTAWSEPRCYATGRHNRYNRTRQGRQIRHELIPARAETACRPLTTGKRAGRTPINLGGNAMDPRVRILTATGVILTGLLVALAFRHPAARVEPPAADAADALAVRKQMRVGHGPAGYARRVGRRARFRRVGCGWPTWADGACAARVGRRPARFAQIVSHQLPSGHVPLGASLGSMIPEPDRPPPTRLHRIADGDSLATLAEQYLGSPSRATEIFQANRDVLDDPQLLPIGAELKIPPQNRPATP